MAFKFFKNDVGVVFWKILLSACKISSQFESKFRTNPTNYEKF